MEFTQVKIGIKVNFASVLNALENVPKQIDYWILKDIFTKAGFEVTQMTGHLVIVDPITHKMFDLIIIKKKLQVRDGLGQIIKEVPLSEDVKSAGMVLFEAIKQSCTVLLKVDGFSNTNE